MAPDRQRHDSKNRKSSEVAQSRATLAVPEARPEDKINREQEVAPRLGYLKPLGLKLDHGRLAVALKPGGIRQAGRGTSRSDLPEAVAGGRTKFDRHSSKLGSCDMDEIGTVTACMRRFANGGKSEEDFVAIHRWLSAVLLRQLGGRLSPPRLNTPEDITAAALFELYRGATAASGRSLSTVLQDGHRGDLARWVAFVARRLISRTERPHTPEGEGRIHREADSPDAFSSPLTTAASREVQPDDEAARRELVLNIQTAIEQLPEKQRIACLLRLDGATYAEIAQETGVSERQVQRWFAGEIRDRLEELLGLPEEDDGGQADGQP